MSLHGKGANETVAIQYYIIVLPLLFVHALSLGRGTGVSVTLHTTQPVCLAVAPDIDSVALEAAAVNSSIYSQYNATYIHDYKLKMCIS